MRKETEDLPTPEENTKLSDQTRWPVVLITVAGGIVAALHVGKISPALPAIRSNLGLDLVQGAAILNLHEPIENKLFLDRTRKDSNFKRPHICATLFQIEKCWLVVPKLDRLARSVPDARAIADELVARGVKLALGSSVYDPADPMGK